MLFQFPGASLRRITVVGSTLPGATQPVYATVPAGAHQAQLTVNKAAGARITRLRLGTLGRCDPQLA